MPAAYSYTVIAKPDAVSAVIRAAVLFTAAVGAFIGGIGGLIVALPLTTLGMAYYKRYVVKDADPT